MKIKIAPSILAADASRLGDEIREVEGLGIDFWHIDIMDGHFVPNISIGPAVVRDLRPCTKLPLETHLMIDNPLRFIDQFVEAGADIVTLHIETIGVDDFRNVAKSLHGRGKRVAISLNPATKAAEIKDVLSACDMVLVMAVIPGFGGQKFMPEVIPKITEIRAGFGGDIAVDGGIDAENARLCIKAGANVLACGSYIFKSNNRRQMIERLKSG